jgi:hypothetical protein
LKTNDFVDKRFSPLGPFEPVQPGKGKEFAIFDLLMVRELASE